MNSTGTLKSTPVTTASVHILAEYSQCDPSVLGDGKAIEALLVEAAAAVGATIVARKTHAVASGGIISMVVLEESHLSIHTWPEKGYAAADFFTCGNCVAHNAHPVFEKVLGSNSSQIAVLERGLPGEKKMRVLGHRGDKQTNRRNHTSEEQVANANTRSPDSKHLVVEFSDCDPGVLVNPSVIEGLLISAAKSIGAKVAERVMHQFRPSGVTGCVISSDSHLAIHTWPEAGYVSADLYTCRPCDVELAKSILEQGLHPQNTQTILIDRGMIDNDGLQIRGFSKVVTYNLDFSNGGTPEEITISQSAGRGFGMYATRDFAVGDLIYETLATMAERDSEFVVTHDAGRSVHSADAFGYELTSKLIETWPQTLQDIISEQYELKDPSPESLLQYLSDNYQREVLVTAFDGLKNHSNHSAGANTLLDWSRATVSFNEEGHPTFGIPTTAIKPINKGDELLVDYRGTLPCFVAPTDWLS